MCGGFGPRFDLVSDLVFFQHQPSQKSKSLTCCYLVPRFWVTPYLVPIGTVDLKKNMFPSTSFSFLFQIKAVAHISPQLAVYTTYIPLIYCLLGDYIYITYHLLREPETAVDLVNG